MAHKENKETSYSMNKRECRWVRSLLPLWVGDGCPEQSAGSGEGRRPFRGGPLAGGGASGGVPDVLPAAACDGSSVPPLSTRPVPSLRLTARGTIAVAGSPAADRRGEPDRFRRGDRGLRLVCLTGCPICSVRLDRALAGSRFARGLCSRRVASGVALDGHRSRSGGEMAALATIEGNTAPIDRVLTPGPVEDVATKLAELDDDDDSNADQLADADPAARLPKHRRQWLVTCPPSPRFPNRFGHDVDRGTAPVGFAGK